VSRFANKLFSRLNQCQRHKARFLQKYGDWLDQDFDVEAAEKESDSTDDTLYSSGAEEPSTSSGRKASQLSRAFQAEELTYAAKVSLKAVGKRDESKVVHEAVFTTPTRATKIRKPGKP
jgi:hypothetical protein